MDFDSLIKEKISELDLSELNDILSYSDISNDISENINVYDILLNLVTGRVSINFESIKDVLLHFLFSDLKGVIVLGSELVIIGIVSGLLQNMSSSFGNDTVSKMTTIICSCITAGICIVAFHDVYESCISSVKIMTLSMEVILPVLFTLLISMGGITSATVMNGAIIGSVTSFSAIILTVVMPSIFFSSVFTLGNSISNRNYIKKLASFTRGAALFIIGACITIFSGISSIQGLMASSADGLLMKTAKYSVDNLMPIVGGFAADSFDMIIRCTEIIKNGIGVLGIIVISLLLINPIIKVASITLMFKIISVVIEPIGDDTISDCMNELGNTSAILGAVLFLSALMFFIFLAILIKITVSS